MKIKKNLFSLSVILFILFLIFPLPLNAHDLTDWDDEEREASGLHERYEALTHRMDLDQISLEGLGYQGFEPYGHWVLTAEFGSVWVPEVDENWVPFQHGRWLWNPYYGWVWASGEPWGWVPYHYGRWIHLAFEGWAWIPDSSVQFRPFVSLPPEVHLAPGVRWSPRPREPVFRGPVYQNPVMPSPGRVLPEPFRRSFSILNSPVRVEPPSVRQRMIQGSSLPERNGRGGTLPPGPERRRLLR